MLIWKSVNFFIEKIIFIGYVISAKSIEMDEKNIRAIQEWLTSNKNAPISLNRLYRLTGLWSDVWMKMKLSMH